MKKQKTTLLLVLLMSVSFLSSCNNNNESSKWNYTKEDMSSFIELNAKLTDNGNHTSTFSSDTDVAIFSDTIDKDDVIVFDLDKAAEEITSQKKEYANYAVLKAASVPVSDIVNLDDKDGFKITFETEENKNYGMLLHSSVTPSNSYVMVNKAVEKKAAEKDPQKTFEENYVSSSMSWSDGGKFIVELITNIGTIITGVASENPVAVFQGIMGIVSTLGDNLSDSVSLKDVMNLLKATDKKIDEISAKIDKNTNLLVDEIVRTNANVDQANLNILNAAINDFATNSLTKIENINRNLNDQLNAYYRDFVKKSETINLNLYKNAKGQYESLSLSEFTSATTTNFSLTISDFVNAKKHLTDHKDIVEQGFMDELYKDIDASLATSTTIPQGLDKETLRKYVATMIYEQFNKSYYSSHKDEASSYRNVLLDYMERLMGAKSKTNILNTYLSRLEYLYNFGSEIKDNVLSLSASLMKVLDFNVASASQALLYAGISPTSELAPTYKECRKAIQDFYKKTSEMKDSYSFITSSNLGGGFYRASYNPFYTKFGNDASLKVDFNLEKLTWDKDALLPVTDDFSKHNLLNLTSITKIATRWNLLRNGGIASSNQDYVHYLVEKGIIDNASIESADYLLSLKQISTASYRFITSDKSERELNSSDRSLSLKCVGKGNPGGNYYNVNSTYNYQSNHEADSWYGKTFESNFVDATTGTTIGREKICSWARYGESHWYWTNDEYYCFSNNDNNYFFALETIA